MLLRGLGHREPALAHQRDRLLDSERLSRSEGGELARDGVRTFVEVGPGNVLSGLLRRIDKTAKAIPVNNLAGLKKLEDELATT